MAAVSGGADSVALLLVLHALSQREGFSLCCVHVDHGLRPASALDAAFVAALCDERHIPCRVERIAVVSPGENGARIARYGALYRAFQQEGAQALALAHHMRDQGETLLMHLLRGAGCAGLSAMREVSPYPGDEGPMPLWRPFLSLPSGIIRRCLQEQGIPWREDETNQSDAYLRNYLRHRVLPPILERLPQAEEAMARSARLLGETDDYLSAQAKAFLAGNARLTPPWLWIAFPSLQLLHPALGRYALRLACPVPLEYGHTQALLALRPGQTANLPAGWRALCTSRYLHFVPPAPVTAAPGPLTVLPFEGAPGDGKRLQAIPRALYDRCVLRTRKEGDRIRPLGSAGEQSLQDYFVNRKIDRPFRDGIPLLCLGSQVIWAIGTGIGEAGRVHPGDDAVLLRYDGDLPGDMPQTNTKGD